MIFQVDALFDATLRPWAATRGLTSRTGGLQGATPPVPALVVPALAAASGTAEYDLPTAGPESGLGLSMGTLLAAAPFIGDKCR